jgi:hypothetical protein
MVSNPFVEILYAERLLSALARALKEEGTPYSIEELRREVGFNGEKAA